MKIEFRHPLPAEPDTAWSEMFSDAYSNAVTEQGDTDTEQLEDTDTDGGRFRRVRVTSRQRLPGFAKKALGVDRLSWEQHESYLPGQNKMNWKVIPATMADRVKAEGTYEVVADGDQSVRVIRGVIEVSIPLVGGKIERAIADELEKTYDKTAIFARKWLTERKS